MALTNNGLPEGLHFKDIRIGTILHFRDYDGNEQFTVVNRNPWTGVRRNYRGHVYFPCFDGERGRFDVEAEQVISVSGHIKTLLAEYDGQLSSDQLQRRLSSDYVPVRELGNNGLPDGLHFKDIREGDILLVSWIDAPPQHVVVDLNHFYDYRKDYKGAVTFACMMPDGNPVPGVIGGDQVLAKVGSIFNDLN